MAAQRLGMTYDQFKALLEETQAWAIAQYEIAWRIEALQAYEREQRLKRERRRTT